MCALTFNTSGNIQVVKDRDASYFKIYSKREYYIRKIDPIEVEEGLNMGQNVNSDAFVLVGQMAPGVRTRLIFTDRDNPPIAEFTLQKCKTSINAGRGKCGQEKYPSVVLDKLVVGGVNKPMIKEDLFQ